MKIITSVFIVFALLLAFSVQSFAAKVVPTVVTASTVPSASTDVALNTTVSVTFSTGMTTSSITTSSFYIEDSAGNQVVTNNPVASNSNKTFTITPTANLAACGTYTIIVTTSVQSSSSPKGNLVTQYSKTFQTITDASAPTVTGRVPAVGATGVNESSPVMVTFSKLMDTTTIDATVFGLDNGATGNITFSTASNVTTALYTPSPNLVSSTLYRATVGTGAKSACNVAMSAPYSWTFTTRDTDAPFVTSTAPSSGAVNIARTSPISINFNEAMQTLSSANISVTDGTTAVIGTVTFDTTSKLTATFTPTSALRFSTVYYVTVTGARDLAGNTMAPNPYTFSFTTVAEEIMQYCNIPPFVSTNLMLPNVLLIMDNSNSMDEDFKGAAVGSYSPLSKSVAGKTALRNIVQTYSDSMRIGLMTYNLPSSSKYYVSNSPYFASYDPKSYCPIPPAECVDYCSTGDVASQTTCRTECQLQNPLFDETYMDEVITAQGTSTRRTKYCELTYPKTSRMINPSDPTRYVYYKQALPFYSSSAPGNEYDYAQNYHPLQEITNTSTATDSYNRWTSKTGTNDNYANYSGGGGASAFVLTDSDLALGYGNIGRRMTSVQIGRTWFANSSPGGGFLQVAADSNDAVNTQKNLLLTKLTTYSGDETGYMSCTNTSNPNNCSYIINTGLTPTAGTLQTATDYFTGNSSPIQERCQKNFVIYVTDGLPSVNSSGTVGTADTLIGTDVSPASGTVLKKLDDLHTISKTLGSTAYNFNVNTYVLGLGLTSDAKSKLEMMAEHGGTNQAYYADNTTQLSDALDKIFRDINLQISSGTSASIVNNRGESGANLFQAVFYPNKSFGGTDLQWTGEIQNLWYYLDPLIDVSSIREDTDFDKYLDLKADDKVTVDYDAASNQTVAHWFTDTTGSGNFTADATANARIPSGSPDNIRPLWRAGALLHLRSAASRSIYSVLGSYNGHYLNETETSPSSSLSGLTNFDITGFNTTTNITPFNSFLNVPDAATGLKVINYIRGVDDPAYRSRAVSITYPSTNPAPLNTVVPINSSVAAGVGIWKLGDIVSSTPQSLTSKQLHAFDSAYNDSSYLNFYNSYEYKHRNMVFAAANDGMLHAFSIGQVSKSAYSPSNPYRIAKLTNLGDTSYVGDEKWGFIPKNALPYLKYLADPAYNHLYYVNNTVSLFDVSINKPSTATATCTQAEYWKCNKMNTYIDEDTKTIDADNTSWRTLLIGGMGLGGASRDGAGFCNNADGATPANSAAETRFDCIKSPITGTGLSSFFALDVTTPAAPKFLWEFSDAVLPAEDKGLGFSTSGPALVRISSRSNPAENYGTPNLSLNGRWFAVFATGPSGPIDTAAHQFMGRSDNRLKVYVVDVHPDLSSGWVKNTNYWVFDSGINNAFAGDINDAVVDVDRWNSSSNGYYSDDVVYIGYTRPNSAGTEWTEGGVLRLLTNDSLNPADWTLSTMIDGVGPVTSAVTKLQDRKNGKLWTYFGSGRYFYKNSTGSDDPSNRRYIMGVQDTCYNGATNAMDSGFKKVSNAWVKQGCGATAPTTLGLSDLEDQTTTIAAALSTGKKGWKIELDPAGDYSFGTPLVQSSYDAERVVTNTIANFNGVIYFTTFKPTNNVCGSGGTTLEWIVDYATGAAPPGSAMKGKLLVQLSGGEFVAIDAATATKSGGDASQTTHGDRRIRASLAGHGIAGSRGGSLQSASHPVRKILHIMEK
ncbi:MAG: Ig-like domain-containing protein [Desulfuromonadaceae bacterium]|nr:Ig-like domain-containing protein [Desulfuromonadaceae bacterium]